MISFLLFLSLVESFVNSILLKFFKCPWKQHFFINRVSLFYFSLSVKQPKVVVN